MPPATSSLPNSTSKSPSITFRRDPVLLLLHSASNLSFPQLLQLQSHLTISPPNLSRNLVFVKLISAFSALRRPLHSLLLLLSLPNPNLLAFNATLQTLSHNHLHPQTLVIFRKLISEHSPDEFSLTSLLKSLAHLPHEKLAFSAHAFALKRSLDRNLFVRNCLIAMYFKFNCISRARHLFDEMPDKDVVSWNTVITGFCNVGFLGEARRVFDEMPERSFVSWSAMIAGYCRRGECGKARELFDEMPERNVGCWNAMIAGYAQNERFSECLALFREMMEGREVVANEVTVVSVLSACAHLGALDFGRWIEGFVIEKRSMELGIFLGNALSDMYAKCGCIGEARRVFDKMRERDVISWSIIITASAMHGYAGEAISAFREMLIHDVKPNEITFMGVLSACTHTGMVDDGLKYFKMMSDDFRIAPKVEHYGCIIDLLSRAGRLDEAENMINGMQVAPNAIVWGALLGGCRIYKDVSRGERVVQRILELDPDHPGCYVYLANAYASMGKLEDAAKFRLMMHKRRVVKTPGCSWIEVDNVVHEFLMGDRSHPQSEKIYMMISSLRVRIKLAGYVPDISLVPQTIAEEEKENALWMHSEKLAVAFGLISLKDGTTIRVVKNLRVCNDCHEAMKFISKIVNREIVLRDRNRFHHFKDGACSCKDYW